MQPAPMHPVPLQHIDPQFGPLVSESSVGGKRYWTVVGLVLFLGVFALVGFVAALAEGSVLGALIVGLLMLGLVLALCVLSGVAVIVYTHGIERRGRFGRKRLGWDQLESYTLNIVDPSHAAAGAGGVIGVLIVRLFSSNEIKPQAVVLRGKNGEKISIPNQLKDYDALLASLVPYLTERLAGQVHSELSRGVPVSFGKRLTLDPQSGIVFNGLLGGKQSTPFHEIESMNFERALLAIRKHGETKPWQNVAIAAIPNVVVLQRIVLQASRPRQAPAQSENFSWAR
jgi:hypothetical protein